MAKSFFTHLIICFKRSIEAASVWVIGVSTLELQNLDASRHGARDEWSGVERSDHIPMEKKKTENWFC